MFKKANYFNLTATSSITKTQRSNKLNRINLYNSKLTSIFNQIDK